MERGTKVNPEKCDMIIKIETSTMKKKIARLDEMLTNFSKFISRPA